MSGSGECWNYVLRRIKPAGRIVSVDICPAMCKRQHRRLSHDLTTPIEIRCENALSTGLAENSVDHVVSAFGLKTFNGPQLRRLIIEILRILRPSGSCSMLEISVPDSRLLQISYLFYIGRVIPWIGRIFLKNIECYRMLGVYTEAFGSCKHVAACLGEAGFRVTQKRHFFGCASSVIATKPGSPS
jgi:demethylmenaquinone methyltransferase/2-methoxy-6-polyprenyl-1,4-benzoquinol methylase